MDGGHYRYGNREKTAALWGVNSGASLDRQRGIGEVGCPLEEYEGVTGKEEEERVGGESRCSHWVGWMIWQLQLLLDPWCRVCRAESLGAGAAAGGSSGDCLA